MFHLETKARKAEVIEWRRQFRPAFRFSFPLSQVVAPQQNNQLSASYASSVAWITDIPSTSFPGTDRRGPWERVDIPLSRLLS